jgi:PAS domain S-box-containing protein
MENAALLLVLAFVYDLIARHFRRQTMLVKILTGVVLGAIALAVMLASWRLPSGTLFDTRSVVLSVGTLFFGTIPGLVAGAIAAAYRISQGGSGAFTGASVIAMSVGVGIVWRHLRRTWQRDPVGLELYLFGLTVNALVLALMFSLPWPAPLAVLKVISLPVIVIYPLATLLLGLLLVDQRRRRRSEEALRESEERARTIVAALPGGIVQIVDRDFRYLYADGEVLRELGLSSEELAGKSTGDVLGATIAETVEAQYRRVLEGETVRFEVEYEGRTLLATAAPLRDEDGEVDRILTLSVNISDRKQAEDEVRRLNADLEVRVHRRTAELELANREAEAIAYSVAHDLRGPLRAVDGFSAMIAEESGGDLNEESRDHLRRVRAAVQRMGRLIDDLLQLSRLSRAEMAVQVVDLSALARELAADLARSEPQRAVEIVVAADLVAHGDAGLLRVVLGNLLDNAWKFTRHAPAARIAVGVAAHDKRPAYFVRDNGVGFEQAHVGKLFRPFERLHDEAQFEGSGIGLASVARIVARHHGEVWAEGLEGGGAAFFFTLGEPE